MSSPSGMRLRRLEGEPVARHHPVLAEDPVGLVPVVVHQTPLLSWRPEMPPKPPANGRYGANSGSNPLVALVSVTTNL